MRRVAQLSLCRCAIAAIVLSLCTPSHAEVRLFLAGDGLEAEAPSIGATTLAMTSGSTERVLIWLQVTPPSSIQVSSYQLLFPWDTIAKVQGEVGYLDLAPGQGGGDSIHVDTNHPEWLFRDAVAAIDTYQENPPDIRTGEGSFGTLTFISGGPAVTPVADQFYYLGEFQLTASNGALGEFLMLWLVAQTSLGGTSGAISIDRIQSMDVLVCAPAEPAIATLANSESRYLTITPQNAGQQTALRVTLDELHVPDPSTPDSPDFSTFNGQARWVGPPVEYSEGVGGPPTFYAAQLQCTPHFDDWSRFGTISVYGDAIVPSSTYVVQAIDETCNPLVNEEGFLSSGLPMTTSRWGDVAEPFQPPSAFTQPNINDILLVVDKFLGAFPPLKSSTQLLGNVPDPSVKPDINDILLVVDSFLGKPYPYAGPSACP